MSAIYTIEVMHLDREGWFDELRQAVAQEIRDIGLHRSVSVVVTDSHSFARGPVIGVCLGSVMAVNNDHLSERISVALAEGVVVIPVVDELAEFSSHVCPALAFANGFEWRTPNAARRLARLLLEDLGIEDRERRVFMSHKRDDGLGAAEQLHDRLSHVGFRPFIDRFAIRIGEDVQRSIADALEDYAFLLLLETPLASTSEWVFDEVDYALSHTMGALILRWPGEVELVPGSVGIPRLQMEEVDIVKDQHGYDIFNDAALEKIIEAVEASHAEGLVRRRKVLVRSIEEAAKVSGCTACVPLADWQLWVEHPDGATLVGITPRLPTASDLQKLDLARSDAGSSPNALLVHSARSLSSERIKHLEWVTGERELALTPENAIGAWWQSNAA